MRKLITGLMMIILILICAAALSESGIAVGDKVSFGNYKQHMLSDNAPAEPEPITWLVLDVNGSKALLLVEQPLVGMPYNSDANFVYDVTWEKCSLRAWLNGTFLSDAFSAAEQQAIVLTHHTNPDNSSSGAVISGGNETDDNVFLLSPDEAARYLKTETSRQCTPTDYAVFTGAGNSWGYYSDDSYHVDQYHNDVCLWWLRSPGNIGHYTAYCSFDGSISYFGQYSGDGSYSVRPAVWVQKQALVRKGT